MGIKTPVVLYFCSHSDIDLPELLTFKYFSKSTCRVMTSSEAKH